MLDTTRGVLQFQCYFCIWSPDPGRTQLWTRVCKRYRRYVFDICTQNNQPNYSITKPWVNTETTYNIPLKSVRELHLTIKLNSTGDQPLSAISLHWNRLVAFPSEMHTPSLAIQSSSSPSARACMCGARAELSSLIRTFLSLSHSQSEICTFFLFCLLVCLVDDYGLINGT